MMTDKHFPGEILVGLNKRNPQALPSPGHSTLPCVPSVLCYAHVTALFKPSSMVELCLKGLMIGAGSLSATAIGNLLSGL